MIKFTFRLPLPQCRVFSVSTVWRGSNAIQCWSSDCEKEQKAIGLYSDLGRGCTVHGSVIVGLLLVLRQPMKTGRGRSHVWASNPVPNSGARHAHVPRTRQPNISKRAAGCSLQALPVNCAQTGSRCTVAGGWPARACAAVSTSLRHSSARFKPQAGLNDKAYEQASSIHSLSPVVCFPNNVDFS